VEKTLASYDLNIKKKQLSRVGIGMFCYISTVPLFGTTKFTKQLPYTSFGFIYAKAIDIYRQFTLHKTICYHYTNEFYPIVPALFVMTAQPQSALWSIL
jgi:hypothetical protein